MPWIRFQNQPDQVINLEGFASVEAVASDDPSGESARWEVYALPAQGTDHPHARIYEGTRVECAAVVDEIAKAVWAMEVPSPSATSSARPGGS